MLGFETCDPSEEDCPSEDEGGGLSTIPGRLIPEDEAGAEEDGDSDEPEDVSKDELLEEESEDELWEEEPEDKLDEKEDELPSDERETIVDWHPDRSEMINTAVNNSRSFFKIPLRVTKCFFSRAFLTILYNIPTIRSTSIFSCFQPGDSELYPQPQVYIAAPKGICYNEKK